MDAKSLPVSLSLDPRRPSSPLDLVRPELSPKPAQPNHPKLELGDSLEIGPEALALLEAAKRSFESLHLNEEGNITQRQSLLSELDLDSFRKLKREKNGLGGFRPEFLPVLVHDLRENNFLSDREHGNILERIHGVVGAFGKAGELIEKIDQDGDGFVSLQEAKRAGLEERDFASFDRDGDGKVAYLEEFIPKVASRLYEDRLITKAEYARILAGIKR